MRNGKAHFGDRGTGRFRLACLVAMCLSAFAGVVQAAGIGAEKLLYTPGYFLDQPKFDKGTYRYYHDYELERSFGVTPSIFPYLNKPSAVLDWAGYDSLTFTVKDAGRYVSAWRFYAHGDDCLVGEVAENLDYQHSYTVTYSFLAGLNRSPLIPPSEIDVIPLLKIMQFNLSYDKNGGEWKAQPAAKDYLWSNRVSVATSAVISREGHEFQGWNRKKDGSGLKIAAGASFDSAGTGLGVANHQEKVVLYAQWQVLQYNLQLMPGAGIDKIYYKVNGATSWKAVSASTVVKVDYGTKWQVYATPKAGYTYTATSAAKPMVGTMGVNGDEFKPSAAANVIRVVYDGNGKTSGSMAETSFTYGQAVYLAYCDFKRSYSVTFNRNYGGGGSVASTVDYAFTGWNDKPDGSGAYSYKDHAEVTNLCGAVGGKGVLYAQWQSNAVELENPGRTGYSFGGWYAEPACVTKVGKEGDRYVPTKDVTLYAKWTLNNYTVSFVDGHRDAGDALIQRQTVGYGGKAKPPSPPAHEWWRFTGWDSDAYLNVTRDMTVRALYEPLEYRGTYHSNYRDGRKEGAVASAACGPNSSSDTIVMSGVGDAKFSKVGYEFLGWAWRANAMAPEWTAGEKMSYSVIVDHYNDDDEANLYAVWKPISYQIRFDSNGGEGEMPNQTLYYDRPALLDRNAFVCAGKTFREWKDAKGNRFADEAIVSNLTTTAGETIALVAQWDEARLHFVRFDPNGATNGEMAVQQFRGAESQRLYANAFAKPGYTFAGWATASNETAIACSNRADYAFREDAPHGSTNTLYAVWATNRYTVIFNVGTNDVYGTIQPMTNCAYDTVLSLPFEGAGYTNFLSQGLLGWSLTPGAGALITNTAVNLAEGDGDCVTLYARWKGIGDLSEAAGLTNAVLRNECLEGDQDVSWCAVTNYIEESGHPDCVALWSTKFPMSRLGRWNLRTRTIGSGKLSFRWYWEPYASIDEYTKYKIRIDEGESSLAREVYWSEEKVIPVVGTGVHEIVWEFNGNINDGTDSDLICVDDITWTPDPTWQPAREAYRLTYANTKGAAGLSALPATYAVTNETFAFAPLANVEGFAFDGWAPSKIVKGTTGDITVTARWRPLIEAHKVVFSLGGGTHLGGGALEQQVEHGFAAVPPQVKPPAGKIHAGWDTEFANVTKDLTVTARYEPEWYRIDYENTLGLANPNPLRFTAADEFVFAPLADTDKSCFCGWTPPRLDKGTASNVTIRAIWVDHAIPAGCYAVVLGDAVMDCKRDKVYRLPLCEVPAPAGKRCAGWISVDGRRRYDQEILVFNLAAEGRFYPLSPIWENCE